LASLSFGRGRVQSTSGDESVAGGREEGRKLQICVAVSKVRIAYSCKMYASLIIFKINYRCFKAKTVPPLITHITKAYVECR